MNPWRLVAFLCSLLCLLPGARVSAEEAARWHIVDRATIEAFDLRTVADALALVPGFAAVPTRQVNASRAAPSNLNHSCAILRSPIAAWVATASTKSP
jgi:enoyl-CoA hydratase/carnithine racemase